MEGLRKGMSVQYSVKQKVTDAVEESTGRRRRSGMEAVGEEWSEAMVWDSEGDTNTEVVYCEKLWE